MRENTDLIYYQRNKDGMLNKAKIIIKILKERLSEQARDKYRNLSEDGKNNKENIRKIDIIICLRKRNKD